MHFHDASSLFSVYPPPLLEGLQPVFKTKKLYSTSLPFCTPVHFTSISGPTYVTPQLLIQQVAYALSDKLFTYSPDTFDLDIALHEWQANNEINANGYATSIQPMQIRNGAGTIALGYMFSKDYDLKKRHIPQGIFATSSGLQFLRPTLEQLSLLYSLANPFVAHISAIDYAGGEDGKYITDYTSAMSLAEDLGLGLVASQSAYESQHMALFTTALAQVLPMIHIYDGLRVGRETTRVVDILDQSGLSRAYKSVIHGISESESKHLDVEGRVMRLLKSFNDELGTVYKLFEYAGHSKPETVLVSFGTVESSLAAQMASKLADDGLRVGVVSVRVYRPFVEEEFLKALPLSTKTVVVLGQVQDIQGVEDSGVHSNLYEDVLATLAFSSTPQRQIEVQELKYSRDQSWTPATMAGAFYNTLVESPLLSDEGLTPALDLLEDSVQQYSFWDVDESSSVGSANALGQALAKDSAMNVTINITNDNLVQGGVRRTDIRKSAKSLEAPYPVQSADVSVVGEVKLVEKLGLLSKIKRGGKLILKLPSVKDEDVEKRLPAAFKREIVERSVGLYLIDPSLSKVDDDSTLESFIVQAAFLRVALARSEGIGLQKLAVVNGTTLERLEQVAQDLENTLRQIEVPKSWAELETNKEEHHVLPVDVEGNSFVAFDKEENEPPSLLRNWQKSAKALLFKEAYGTRSALRPDLPSKSHTVHVKENRRLTPLTYDRNIFHIEFDIGDSGLKYDIGEALGIHAENDPIEVMEFIKFYGLDPEEMVEVASRDDPSVFENRTVFQSLVQNVDIFGRPPKRFYEALAEFADDENEKKKLLTLGGPEGAKEFQRRAEVDTVTFADILLEFPSAHPSFHDMVRIVSPMKRREYSIASCQAVTPNSVALMVVVVNWVDPKGRNRFGQATHYLSKLKPGAPVTVSVKPSVMKLPPKSTQPLIMAGLGTGLAPFRAFVQHRAMEKAQGKEIGAVLLYMGSRHQREEYCYGEEWEAYQAAGVITLLGRAFSRDQPQKIYIQDRMRQSIDEIAKAYLKEEGAFYLCGPTWPVPDVTAVLEEAICKDAAIAGTRGKKVDSKKEIERLKDMGRYVLEVY